MNLKKQEERANLARAHLRARKSVSLAILKLLELLTAERPDYGDEQVAHDLGVSVEWVSRIRQVHDLKWRTNTSRPRRPRRTYSPETVQDTVEALRRNGGNVKRTTRETRIPENTVRRWKHKHLGRDWPHGSVEELS